MRQSWSVHAGPRVTAAQTLRPNPYSSGPVAKYEGFHEGLLIWGPKSIRKISNPLTRSGNTILCHLQYVFGDMVNAASTSLEFPPLLMSRYTGSRRVSPGLVCRPNRVFAYTARQPPVPGFFVGRTVRVRLLASRTSPSP
ncbi:hypothetical protein PISMIDRAFT_267140 [Pisolithus microcarpus 441]|uniref:Uncharacterized protein n=1 Tax=Pisolithus microcarpus 441 TaxID=765257 RepID=A0A0C9YRQ6_9AGAM|nr:hypothetical protein PISMIDRAFT_267140 [Pisolithus microcarpus 441]